MASDVTITIQTVGDKTRVAIGGTVTEEADFSALAALTGNVEINLKGVRRLNSAGIREWVNAIRPLSKRARLLFVECAPPVIGQLNMITGFLGDGEVRSFYAPMLCPRCEANHDQLLDRAAADDGVPSMPCPACGTAMEFDDVESEYLLFLREPTRVG